MQTFDQSILSIFRAGLISYDEALRWASNVDEFKLRCRASPTTQRARSRRNGRRHARRDRRSRGLADPVRDAYVAGLTMLARRELSEAQVRQRLLRRGHRAGRRRRRDRPPEIRARHRRCARGRGHRPHRSHSPPPRTAAGRSPHPERRCRASHRPPRRSTRSTASSMPKRSSPQRSTSAFAAANGIADQKEFQRLYRYLLGQGFESDKVLALLRRRSKPSADDPGDDGCGLAADAMAHNRQRWRDTCDHVAQVPRFES